MWFHYNRSRSQWPHPRQHQKKRGKTATWGRNSCDQLVHRAGKGRGSISEGRCSADRLSSGLGSEMLDRLSRVGRPTGCLWPHTHTTISDLVFFKKNLNCGSSLNISVWKRVDLDLVLIAILSAPRGRTVVSICQDFENSNHLYNLPPLSPPSRTWSQFKKHFGRVLSRRGPGPSAGFAGLSDPPPVLLAQFVGQPAWTTGIRTFSLEFSGTHSSQPPFTKTYQWFKLTKTVKMLIIVFNQ